jgi:hypothetical protein
VEEGLFVSDEPAEVLDQQLELPNQDGVLSKDVERALIEKLAEQLGIDPQYISLNGGPVDGASRRRALSGGLALKVTILSDDSSALAATLEALTSDPSFWQGVNDRLIENNATTTLDTSGIVAQAAVPACNEHFNYNSATETCVAVPISCGIGTFAAAGSGECQGCPRGKYSQGEGMSACATCMPGHFGESGGSSSCTECGIGEYQPGFGQLGCIDCPESKYGDTERASACESCMPGHFGVSAGSSSCTECGMTKYQPGAGQLDCEACPEGKFANGQMATFCNEVESLKSYLAISDNTGEAVEVSCPRAGIGKEVTCGAGRLVSGLTV